jgi:uncharacterized protein
MCRPEERLDVVYTKRYSIDSPLWNSRAKSLIVSWIPALHRLHQPHQPHAGQGGIDNFVEAAKALRGEPHGAPQGLRVRQRLGASNGRVHVHCVDGGSAGRRGNHQGAGVDAGDAGGLDSKNSGGAGAGWIHADGLHFGGPQSLAGTLGGAQSRRSRGLRRRLLHRVGHQPLHADQGKDKRLYDAAKKLADCWVANIGPGKKEWYDGHQEMEQALVRFGRFVNDMEGNGRGDSYVQLAKFLLDCRKDGSEYDQSHVPVQQQYEAVGHAVRAVYSYSGMADVAAETGDMDYQSAVMSLWDNMVNRKYYVTGGIGSGETSEGFGPDYSLRNNAYCESCSSCGLIFLPIQTQHRLSRREVRRPVRGNDVQRAARRDRSGRQKFLLHQSAHRRPPHSVARCPCCVGNIPRTLLMIPTWTYVKGKDGIYVNLFIGSTINVEASPARTSQMVQKTDYPWDGKVTITVNPKQAKKFSVYVRVPDRKTSELYTGTPEVKGLKSFAVNGTSGHPKIENGYAVVTRDWKAGDKIELELPMEVQRIKSDEKIVTNKGLVALRYGPLIYNVERADQPDINLA